MSNFLNSLKKDELLGLRVAIGLVFIFLISNTFSLERSYWAVVTVLTLNITVNFSDILARSWHGLLTSIIGLVLGTLAEHYFLAGSSAFIKNIFLIIATIITLYFMFIDHPLEVFFLSFYIVFLLSFFDKWSICLLEVRLLDIAIGTIVALSVGYILITSNQKKLFINELEKLYKDTKEFLLSKNEEYEYRFLSIQKLHQKKETLLEEIKYSDYDSENREFYRDAKELLNLVDTLTYSYDKWHDMYSVMRQDRSAYLDLMGKNVEIILNGDFISMKLVASNSQEKILLMYYDEFIESVKLCNLKYEEFALSS